MPKTYELELEDYWRIIKRRKAIVIGVFFLISSATFLHSVRMPPIFKATSTIKIERQMNVVDDTQIDWNTDFIETQMQIINSREVAEESTRSLGFFKEKISPEKWEGLVSEFQGVKTERRGRTNIVDISTTANDPEKAAGIVNAV